MNAIQRIAGYIGDSPTYGRDRANLISGGTIGVAGLLLNFGVLALVLPLMLDADDPDFLLLTENLEFGHLLALILLGGATAFATLLVPLRMMTVFWGPRVGRYFDQVVLSGISPLRFVIGKATSQNLFLALILFLLLPYLVLSLTLGGVDLVAFTAGLFLIWLYCIALALVTLWASLYMNELAAALFVIVWTFNVAMFGCFPLPFQPFVVTPFPALLQPVYASIPDASGWSSLGYWPTFAWCAAGMTSVIGLASFAIHLGPLYGIIRENSTFGEVVREGDSKRKRWSRLRQHIQRPSEIAFFYENRSAAFRRREGLLRWGSGFVGLTLLTAGAFGGFLYLMSKIGASSPRQWQWVAYEFHISTVTIHGIALVLASVLFSHTKNSTFLRVPLAFGRSAEVARLDTVAFLLFWLFSTVACLATPFLFESFHAAPLGESIFASPQQRQQIDFLSFAIEGPIVIAVAGLTVYALQRLLCLSAWMRFSAFAGVALLYAVLVCMFPILPLILVHETRELRAIESLDHAVQHLAMVSPFPTLLSILGELKGSFSIRTSTIPFYTTHGVMIVAALFAIRRRGRKLRTQYLAAPSREGEA